jgi:NAD+ diphosphatase
VSRNDGPMILGRLALARGTLDRAAHRRGDTRWLAQAWADHRTRVLIVDDGEALVRFSGGDESGAGAGAGQRSSAGAGPGSGEGNSAGAGNAELVLVSPAEAPNGSRILLGVDADGIAYFAVLGPLPDPGPLSGPGQDSGIGRIGAADRTAPGAAPGAGEPPGAGRGEAAGAMRPEAVRSGPVRAAPVRSWPVRAGLRQTGALLGDRDAGLFTHAVALANWHATHEHCPRCGARTRLATAGHTRVCPRDGSEHFPRVDPAVIMLVLDPADRCLLARNQKWPQKRVSILAGFVEPGESVEQAVAREVREEVGISVADFRYLGSQPWPMPQSLMLGFCARAIADGPSDQSIRVDDDEIAEARWYSRDELRAAIEAGDILLPPPVSIAHRIVEAWYGAPLPAPGDQPAAPLRSAW